MHFEIVTVVPEAVEGYLAASILGRAAAAGTISFGITELRVFGDGKHRQVDDAPYGGGSGMLMKPGPLVAAIEAARAGGPPEARTRVVLMSPAGTPFDRPLAGRLARDTDHLILVCGRYEGIDARVHAYADELISVGDFVLTGGELAALVVVDAVARLVPGVLGNDASAADESFEGPLLEYPQYTRPRVFRGEAVPDVLLSGDHARVDRWRLEQAVQRTLELRPDRLSDRETLPDGLGDLVEALDSGADST
jgi:tRNA (guanine37-N1)-methyltransferase